jgi:BirA family biotin operon repressor/biotin-[acetyl-CoA-carboxylase] ligase
MAKAQTEGRGQRGTKWLSLPQQNLTVSFYLKPHDLPLSKQFFLTVIGSLAVRDTLKRYTDRTVWIKWPNDIYIDDKKISGLLFENRISGRRMAHAILGVGVNILQTDFPPEFAQKTTSLKLLTSRGDFAFIEIIQQIQGYLSYYNELLRDGHHDRLLEAYNSNLYQKGQLKTYKAAGQIFEGEILDVEEDGLLPIFQNGIIKKYDLKDVHYQL